MATEITREQRRDYAKKIYLSEPGITQKELAERVGVSQKTMCAWVKDGKWEELKTSMLTAKDEVLSYLYLQLKEIRDSVMGKDKGERVMNSKEADSVLKITASIKNLETETNTAEKIETGKQFLNFVRKTSGVGRPEFVKEVASLFDAYIKSCF
ncbi:MAG: DDE transposase family protein [Bacteroidales bacterium]|jgi:DNA-binding XRE family transcriptional regulator|nr:DDE transposase family protein [Bacteroidales bacterium]